MQHYWLSGNIIILNILLEALYVYHIYLGWFVFQLLYTPLS